MMPIGPLMIEHRLIERMISLIKQKGEETESTGKADTAFIDAALDFMRFYADKCHHGKEEDILFKELDKRQLSAEHRQILGELIAEHTYARSIAGSLAQSKAAYANGDTGAAKAIAGLMKNISDFYPAHIAKEDKRFFIPCMKYFTAEEQAKMLEEFRDYDKQLVHEKYRKVVEDNEKNARSV